MFVLPLHKLRKQWKLYNWLNIVNIFKKKIDFSFEKRKNFSVQPSIINKNAEALLDASKEIGLEVNSEKTKYWVKQKVFAFFKWKVNHFLKYIYNILSIM
jgi:ABC-type antimicrobial peptide transport system ATPase subunit